MKLSVINVLERGIFTCSTCCTLEGELELLGLQTQGQGGWQGDNGKDTAF